MSAIATLGRLSGHQRIAGQLVQSSGGTSIVVIDPATEERIGEVIEASPSDIDQAIAAANAAQRTWRAVNTHRRAEPTSRGVAAHKGKSPTRS